MKTTGIFSIPLPAVHKSSVSTTKQHSSLPTLSPTCTPRNSSPCDEGPLPLSSEKTEEKPRSCGHPSCWVSRPTSFISACIPGTAGKTRRFRFYERLDRNRCERFHGFRCHEHIAFSASTECPAYFYSLTPCSINGPPALVGRSSRFVHKGVHTPDISAYIRGFISVAVRRCRRPRQHTIFTLFRSRSIYISADGVISSACSCAKSDAKKECCLSFLCATTNAHAELIS